MSHLSSKGTRRDGATIKRERIAEIEKMLSQFLATEESASLSRMIAIFEFRLGLSKKTIREYLGVLEELGFYEIDESLDLINRGKNYSDNG